MKVLKKKNILSKLKKISFSGDLRMVMNTLMLYMTWRY